MPDISTRAEKRNVPEQRAIAREFELRDVPNGSGGTDLTFTGYASVTETPYEMEDWYGEYTEIIRAGAFTKTLADGADVPFKLNHDGITLARTKSGTMDLAEDSTGLHVTARFDPESPAIQTLRSAVNRGDVNEMSFGFRVIRQEWSPDYTQRDITEVSLHKGDVSLVNYGANPHTAGLTSLRSRDVAAVLAEWRETASPEDIARLRHALSDVSKGDPSETESEALRSYLEEQAAKRSAFRRI